MVVVPDSGSTYRLPTTAGAFTTTVASFSFSNGMPTAYNSQRASELLAFVRMPVDIMKAFASVPAQILSARINYDNQATARENAKVELLKVQLEALQAQRALDAAKVNQTTGLAP